MTATVNRSTPLYRSGLLSHRVVSAIGARGINTVGDVLDAGMITLKSIDRIGPLALDELNALIHQYSSLPHAATPPTDAPAKPMFVTVKVYRASSDDFWKFDNFTFPMLPRIGDRLNLQRLRGAEGEYWADPYVTVSDVVWCLPDEDEPRIVNHVIVVADLTGKPAIKKRKPKEGDA